MREEKAERREDVERRRTVPSAFIVALRSLVATSHEMTLLRSSPVKSVVSSLESHMQFTCGQHTHAIAHTTTPQRLTQPTSAGGRRIHASKWERRAGSHSAPTHIRGVKDVEKRDTLWETEARQEWANGKRVRPTRGAKTDRHQRSPCDT